MTVLVIGEHDNHTVKPATLHLVSAAQQLGEDIPALLGLVLKELRELALRQHY